jgi:hypothetical protein
MEEIYRGWMVLTERKGFTEALSKPVAGATNWQEAFAQIVLPSQARRTRL